MTVDSPVDKPTMMKLMWGVVEQAFDVRAHVEEKAFPALALVVGKHAPDFRSLDPAAPPVAQQFDIGAGVVHFQTVAQLVAYLNSYRDRSGGARRRIIDETGLAGRYDIELGLKRPAGTYPIPILALVKQRLGLETVPTNRKAELEYVMIDGAQQLESRWIRH